MKYNRIAYLLSALIWLGFVFVICWLLDSTGSARGAKLGGRNVGFSCEGGSVMIMVYSFSSQQLLTRVVVSQSGLVLNGNFMQTDPDTH